MNQLIVSRVWRPAVWQLELRRDPQGELAQVMLRDGAMGFSRIPERKSANDMHHRGDLDSIQDSRCVKQRGFSLFSNFGPDRSNVLDSESLHTVVLRAFLVMSQSISEWMFRPILVML
jgi:hypothetical protein